MGTSRRFAGTWALLFAVVVFGFCLARPQPARAAIHNVNGWAWSGNTGWISMNCEDPKPGFPSGDCAAGNSWYGTDIDLNGNLYGWAWSTNAGWVCFGVTCTATNSPATGTPTSDHFCPGHGPCAMYVQGDGEMHGWAYVLGEDDASTHRGWISLNCTDVDPNTATPHACGSSDYAVGFDEATGQFADTGARYSYGWNGNGDSTGNGWVQFTCGFPRPCGGAAGDWGVTTGWVLSGWSSIDQQEGVYQPSPGPAVGNAQTSIPIVLRNFSAPAGSTLQCFMRTSNGNVVSASWSIPTRQSAVPVYPPGGSLNYTITAGDAAVDGSGNPVTWSYSTPVGVNPAYGCEIVGTPPVKLPVANLIAVHPNNWTFTGAGGSSSSDSNRAKFCLDGNLGVSAATSYFLNTAQCDVEGDLAYTLLKAKGVSVELRCRDAVDDDANAQTDYNGTCNAAIPVANSDRSCRGARYLCITHVAAPCNPSTTCPPLP